MNFTVTGITIETKGITPEQLEQAKIFSGKNAGICYMKDKYFDSAVSDPVKALPRFVATANNAHHSIADHVRVEVLLEDTSKMLAIVLNSLQDYATSEKSGRYTEMTGNSEKEVELYNKWRLIYRDLILKENPKVDDKMLSSKVSKKYPDADFLIEKGNFIGDTNDEVYNYYLSIKGDINLPSFKLAQENARYILSVFTKSTSLGYSTSLRQWNYIYDWCLVYMSNFTLEGDLNNNFTLTSNEFGFPASYFETELYKDFVMLSNFIKENMYVPELRDTKDRCFQFLVTQAKPEHSYMKEYYMGHLEKYADDECIAKDDVIDMTYSISYKSSFVQIAQAQRHRTLKYFMFYNSHCYDMEYFIPELVKGTRYEKEWVDDLETVKEVIPQATLIGIVETGYIEDFILKCKERLCSRAQWEIMNQTKLTCERFINEAQNGTGNTVFRNVVLSKLQSENGVATKCILCGGCKEYCGSAKTALTRKF